MYKKIKYNLNTEVRLDKYLSDHLSNLSRTKIQKLIQLGSVQVDDYIVKSSYKLKQDQIITIDIIEVESETKIKAQNIKLNIIYEDEQIIVVNKQSGIIVHPGVGNKDNTMLNGLMHHCSNLSNISNRPGVIHRLDKETSGVIVFAKTDRAHYFISEQFANRQILKEYKAISWGNLYSNKIIDTCLIRDKKNRLKFKTSDKGKMSYSTCNPVSNYKIPITEINIYPKTGRTHQIRVHLSSIGHPILNDSLYNGGEDIINSFHQNYRKNLKKVIKCINRVALHAFKIEFMHPTLNEMVSFEAPIPDDFKDALNLLNEFR